MGDFVEYNWVIGGILVNIWKFVKIIYYNYVHIYIYDQYKDKY